MLYLSAASGYNSFATFWASSSASPSGPARCLAASASIAGEVDSSVPFLESLDDDDDNDPESEEGDVLDDVKVPTITELISFCSRTGSGG